VRSYSRALLGLCLAVFLWRWGAAWYSWPLAVNQDERVLVERAVHVARTGELHPGSLECGSLPIQATAAVLRALDALPQLTLGARVLEESAGAWPYVIARLLTLAVSVATLAVSAEIGRRLLGPGAGLLAALFLAFMPLSARLSYTAIPEPWMVLGFAAATLAAVRLFQGERRTRDYLWAGACVVFACACKSTGLWAAAGPLAAHFLGAPRRSAGRLLADGSAVAAVFLAARLALIDRTGLGEALRLEASQAGGSSGLFPTLVPSRFFFSYGEHLGLLASSSLGWLALPTSLLGAWGWARWGRKRALAVVGSAPLASFLYVGSFPYYGERSLLALTPALALCAAAGLTLAFGRLPAAARERRAVVACGGALALLTLAWPSAAALREAKLPDTRFACSQWLDRNVPAGSLIVHEEWTGGLAERLTRFRNTHSESVFRQHKEPPPDAYLVLSEPVKAFLTTQAERHPQAASASERFFLERAPIVQFEGDGGTLRGPTLWVFEPAAQELRREPRAILARAAAVCRDLPGVLYRLTFQVEDARAPTASRVSATVAWLAQGEVDPARPKALPSRLRLDVDEGFDLIWDGEAVHMRRPVDETFAQIGRQLSEVWHSGWMSELVRVPLFETAVLDASRAADVELGYAGRARVEDVECDVVQVSLPDPTTGGAWRQWWFVGRADGLPRRLEQRGSGPAGDWRRSWTLSNLWRTETLDDALFRVEAIRSDQEANGVAAADDVGGAAGSPGQPPIAAGTAWSAQDIERLLGPRNGGRNP
jgi:hypothetical protein